MKFEIYVKGELYMTCYNNFVALCNVVSLRAQNGEQGVQVKVIE